MKKSVMIRMVCLIVAVVLLSGSLMVAALTGSPYETLKNSLLGAMMLKNGAIKAEMTYLIDGVVQETSRSDGVFTENASYSKRFDSSGAEAGFIYNTGDMHLITDYLAPDGTQWYWSYLPDEGSTFRTHSSLFGIGELTEETRNSATMRFVELAVDALVGDLKNNITMSQENGMRHISGTLTGSQIPELARAGLDVIVEQNGSYSYKENTLSIDLAAGTRTYERVNINNMKKNVITYEQTFKPMTDEINEQLRTGGYSGEYYGNFYYPTTPLPGGGYVTTDESVEYMITSEELISQYTTDAVRADFDGSDPMGMPLRSVTINYVHGEADVDAAGNLVSLSANGTATVTNMFGENFTLEMRCDVSITDIGTSYIPCPLPDAEQVLTRDFIKNKIGDSRHGFYFKLNPDGSIDHNSITTTWPGEHDKVPGVEVKESTELDVLPAEIDELTGLIEGLEPETGGVVVPEDGAN